MAKRGVVPRLPTTPPRSPADTRRILAKLSGQHPNADTELHFSNAYELLVATILSAQCTDERVNQVTPALFRRYPNARALARADAGELEPQIQSTGFFRAKSRALTGMANEVVQRYGGEIPHTMEELVTLPGVGRKTANVVLGHALGVPGLPVDRHVLRVANRIGIARADDPEIVEQQLTAALPPPEWTRASDTLILHGRRICKPRPLCDRCAVRADCSFFKSARGATLPAARRAPKARGAGRGGGAVATERAANTSAVDVRRAPRARGTGRGGGAVATERAESRSAVDVRRAPKARSARRASGAVATERAESRSAVDVRRAPEARGAGRASGAVATERAANTSAVDVRRAPKARSAGRGGGAVATERAESRLAVDVRRAPEARGTGRGGGAVATERAESRSAVDVRRAPKARGTGRGGGAPRQVE